MVSDYERQKKLLEKPNAIKFIPLFPVKDQYFEKIVLIFVQLHVTFESFYTLFHGKNISNLALSFCLFCCVKCHIFNVRGSNSASSAQLIVIKVIN